MRQLKSFEPGRQERWIHNGLVYSIIDLRRMPGFDAVCENHQEIGDRMQEIMNNLYGAYPYEVALMGRLESGKVGKEEIDILGRFPTIVDARRQIAPTSKLTEATVGLNG